VGRATFPGRADRRIQPIQSRPHGEPLPTTAAITWERSNAFRIRVTVNAARQIAHGLEITGRSGSGAWLSGFDPTLVPVTAVYARLDENMGGLAAVAKLVEEDEGTQGRDIVGAFEADKLFDLGRREAEVSER
jgi:hypothetical protein